MNTPSSLRQGLLALALTILLTALPAHADPTVANVRASQRPGTKLVDIYYDVTGTTSPVSIGLQISENGGTTFSVPATALSGDTGFPVNPGRGKRIVWNAASDWNLKVTDTMKFRVILAATLPPGSMVLIPAGSFQMGDSFTEGSTGERPVHSVYVSAFHMQNTEVTNNQMATVLQWAFDQGSRVSVTSASVRAVGSNQELLDLDDSDCRILWNATTERFELKSAKGSGYPCVGVTWYGCVAYCNFLSEMEGLTPCYNLVTWECNWNANGYRLPTEAEWEKAARGG